jgi:hypothetical protein
MKCALQMVAVVSVLLGIYVIGYLVSTHRFTGSSGSRPIYDPGWSVTVEIEPFYSFFTPRFWAPLHSVDRKCRPEYWRYTERAGIPPSEMVPAIGVVFYSPPRPLLNRIFPTLWDDP